VDSCNTRESLRETNAQALAVAGGTRGGDIATAVMFRDPVDRQACAECTLTAQNIHKAQ